MVETQNKQWKHKINGGKLKNNEENTRTWFGHTKNSRKKNQKMLRGRLKWTYSLALIHLMYFVLQF